MVWVTSKWPISINAEYSCSTAMAKANAANNACNSFSFIFSSAVTTTEAAASLIVTATGLISAAPKIHGLVTPANFSTATASVTVCHFTTTFTPAAAATTATVSAATAAISKNCRNCNSTVSKFDGITARHLHPVQQLQVEVPGQKQAVDCLESERYRIWFHRLPRLPAV